MPLILGNKKAICLVVGFLLLSCATTKVSPPQKTPSTTTTTAQPPPLLEPKIVHGNHYVGIFQNDRIKKSFPAIMDLVIKNGKGNHWQLQGVLRVYAPPKDEGSENYRIISSYYDRIALDGEQLSFAVKQQKIRVVGKGKWKQDKITAFVVVYGFGQGQLHLQRQARSNFSLPSAPQQRPLALSNFKLQHTQFPQRVFSEQGTVKAETDLLHTSKNLLQRNLFDVNYASIDRFGVYYGVLHHERLDAFQYVRLSFVEDREMGTTTAISTLFFAAPQRQKFLVYRHRVGREVMRGTMPLLLGNGDVGEAFLLLNRWDKRGISGVWYSKVHGRIGNIFLMRERFPRLATGAKLVPALPGQGQVKHFSYALQVYSSVAEQTDVVFPARISGTIKDTLQEKTYQISSGNYDFYRGLVELNYEGGSLRYSVLLR